MEFTVKEQVFKFGRISLGFDDTQRKESFVLKGRTRLFSTLIESLEIFLKSKSVAVPVEAEISLSLTLCGKRKIQSLNRTYRKRNKVTDVLSFPLFDSLRKKDGFLPPFIELGDIFICREVALRQACEYELSLEQEVVRQTIHGCLHLLGFDHEQGQQEEKIMFTHEQKIFDKIGQDLGWRSPKGL